MRWKLFTLMLLVGPLALAGPIYKWVDENGVVHYSDQPHQDAQQIHLGAPQTYKPTQYAQPQPEATAAPPVSYTCAVTSPTDQQAFPDADTVSVSAQVDPRPGPDNPIYVVLDGRVVADQPTSGLQFTLGVERGEHSVAVLIRDANGRTVCQSAAVGFSVRQPSLLSPSNPNNPVNNQPVKPNPRPH